MTINVPSDSGSEMWNLAEELWPINRSLSGKGVRESLQILKRQMPTMQVGAWRTGSKAFDWVIPQEWVIEEAYILTPSGEKICDFSESNLNVVGYSTSVDEKMTLDQLRPHLFSLPEQPTAVPYVTSYYERRWGFCLSHEQLQNLPEGLYHAVIRSSHIDGELNYGEVVIPGNTDREIFFSTYICHPSMANNELSGPVVATELAKYVQKMNNYYTYRFVFLPETIGSIAYMAKNLYQMKRDIVAGYVLTCLGDERAFSFLPSRKGDRPSDQIALEVLGELGIDFKSFTWLDRGSDERQYCSPGADLPVSSVMRSRYTTYPEYHTNQDTLGQVVTETGLTESLNLYLTIIQKFENLRFPIANQVGEPQLGRRQLYPTTSIKGDYDRPRLFTNILSLSDGTLELHEISQRLGISEQLVARTVATLGEFGLIRI